MATVCSCGAHAWAPITKGYVVLVDPGHMGLLTAFSWSAHDYARSVYAVRSVRISVDGESMCASISLHQTILPTPRGIVVDHKNGNGLNNCRANLRTVRIAVNSQAQRNRRGKASKFRGVSPSPNAKWRANIVKNGKQIWLGSFETQEQAARAYDAAAFEIFGPMAEFNFGVGVAP